MKAHCIPFYAASTNYSIKKGHILFLILLHLSGKRTKTISLNFLLKDMSIQLGVPAEIMEVKQNFVIGMGERNNKKRDDSIGEMLRGKWKR